MLRLVPTTVGVVSVSSNGSWLGGLYHLHHLVRACATLDIGQRTVFRDVWWHEAPPAADPFAEVRAAMLPPAQIHLPGSIWPRLCRRLRRLVGGYRQPDLADLFHQAGVGVLFPVLPCDHIGIPFVGWITDLHYRHLSQSFTDVQFARFESDHRRTARAAAIVLLSSEAVRRDMVRFFPDLAHKARVVRPCSVPTPQWHQLDPAATAARLGLPERFFLISNQVGRHKNHRTIFEAVRILAARGRPIDIVCTGKTADPFDPTFFGKMEAESERLGVAGQVRFLGAVPRAEHIALMRRSLAVVQPSAFEGWGFAVSDAKALGKPTLASDIAVHHEHESPRLTSVPLYDADAWAAALERAWLEQKPGPDLAAEEEAALNNGNEGRRVGREMNNLFRAALETARRPLGPTLEQEGAVDRDVPGVRTSQCASAFPR
jgi:glycosyltransferase involved in cell wall biosynthesis